MTTRKRDGEQSRTVGLDDDGFGEMVGEGEGAQPSLPNPYTLARASATAPVGRITDDELLAAVDAVESYMVMGFREAQIREATGLSVGRIRRYAGLVRQRWKREGQAQDRQSRKDEHRESARALYQIALTRKRAVTVGIGPGLQRLEHVADPDIRSAIEARRLLAQLDGDMDQPVVSAAMNLTIVQQIQHALGMGSVVDATAEDPK